MGSVTRRFKVVFAGLLLATGGLPLSAQASPVVGMTTASSYANFRVSVYITVGDVRALAERATFDRQFARVASQVHIDKVYIEAYRDGEFATDDELDRVKGYFAERGIEAWGGITLAAGGKNGQFATFDYENPDDRARCARAAALAASHFDAVILDDFFFYNTKSDADIAAKGKRSWTQYRLDKMHEVARDLVIGPARRANPKARVIIKYPNWYEHFQGTGFDLDEGPRLFDGIYTGTETRDPVITDQLLQQYESYEAIRYFDNIAPGRNGGGWVDTYDTRYIDRYAEQLWDTLFAKAPEITLFNWHAMADPGAAIAGDRPWAAADTSFDWDGEMRNWRNAEGLPAGWGRAAGYALDTVDSVLGGLGQPVGVASYKPYQSSGEDFLHNYLGNIGIPIELGPTYPAAAKSVLLTEAAAADPAIVDKIKASLRGGATVVVTSGLVQALADKGFADIAEWTPTGRTVAIDRYVVGSGAGAGTIVDDGGPRAPILVPEIRFYTNDSWAVVRGVGGEKAYPLVLTNDYGAGTIVMLTIPNNPSDLYRLPAPVLAQMRRFASGALPARLVEADDHVALFDYDNNAFVVESYRDAPTTVTIEVAAGARLVALPSGGALPKLTPVPGAPIAAASRDTGTVPDRAIRTTAKLAAPARFMIALPGHSFSAFRIEP
ncbi:hypothetical protein EAH79_05780 [Sphingomonas koreensis]|nr:hypothetical protein EAH79_05780 [Sphingomonas koreensis]